MTEYLILSKYFSTEKPAYALVDDDKYPNQVVCYTVPQVDYKGHWRVIPDGPPGSSVCRIELANDTDHRRAEQDDNGNVMVGQPGTSWMISPPLSEGGPDTPRTIATAMNDRLHVSEWTIHGEPDERGIPDSFVRINTRVFHVAVDPKSFWYIQEIPKA